MTNFIKNNLPMNCSRCLLLQNKLLKLVFVILFFKFFKLFDNKMDCDKKRIFCPETIPAKFFSDSFHS